MLQLFAYSTLFKIGHSGSHKNPPMTKRKHKRHSVELYRYITNRYRYRCAVTRVPSSLHSGRLHLPSLHAFPQPISLARSEQARLSCYQMLILLPSIHCYFFRNTLSRGLISIVLAYLVLPIHFHPASSTYLPSSLLSMMDISLALHILAFSHFLSSHILPILFACPRIPHAGPTFSILCII